jgi:hypothetical protein
VKTVYCSTSWQSLLLIGLCLSFSPSAEASGRTSAAPTSSVASSHSVIPKSNYGSRPETRVVRGALFEREAARLTGNTGPRQVLSAGERRVVTDGSRGRTLFEAKDRRYTVLDAQMRTMTTAAKRSSRPLDLVYRSSSGRISRPLNRAVEATGGTARPLGVGSKAAASFWFR